MTAQTAHAGAFFDDPGHWHGISWTKCHQEVRRLQARIVKATKEGRWGKVKALQWLLTHSFSGKALAVKRVTENQGKKTPGIDNVTWSTPDAKYQAIKALNRRGYQPLPLRRIYIPKSNGKKRALGIPCMADRAQQALHLLALEPIAETKADSHSYGFRTGRSTADAIKHCFYALSVKGAAQWVLEGDIQSCFDKISHEWLITHIPMDKEILRKWLKAGYLEDRCYFRTEAGVSQGGIASPVLANLALDGLQQQLEDAFGRPKQINGKRLNVKVNYIRYADDWLITGHTQEFLENEVKPMVAAFLQERGLKLSPEKTRVTHIAQGFDFLGQNIRTYKGKVLIKPANKNVQRFLAKVRAIIKDNKTAKQYSLIKKLNPVIKGWADYHRHVVSKQTYRKVDYGIWKALWQWCCRRHPNKGKRWIKDRYFQHTGTRDWIFATATDEHWPDGTCKNMTLRTAAETPIQRHIKIRAEANPFDPEWESYFETRCGFQMLSTLSGRKKLIRLWVDQQGLCPICDQRITQETGWHAHHILRRVDGGNNTSGNLILVHPNCHNQIHYLGLNVTKPAPSRGLERREPCASKGRPHGSWGAAM